MPTRVLQNITNTVQASRATKSTKATKPVANSSTTTNTTKQAKPKKTLRVKTLYKVFRDKPTHVPESHNEQQRAQWIDAVQKAAWRRGLAYSSSSTSSSTSEDDDVSKREMLNRIKERLNQYDSCSDNSFASSSSSSDNDSDSDVMNYGGGPGIRMRQMRRMRQIGQKSTTSLYDALASSNEELSSASMRPQLSMRSLPQERTRDQISRSGIVQSKCQLKLVVCGTSKKLTVTVLGLRSLPHVCKLTGLANKVYLKVSLSPDNDNRLRHKTNPEVVQEDVTTLHDTFTYDITRRDATRRLLISAWSKVGEAERPTLIGCMSFGIRNILSSQEVIQGWYYFLRDSLGRKKHLKVKTNSKIEQILSSKPRRATPRHVTGDEPTTRLCRTRSLPRRRRFSNRSGSSDSSLASGYAKTCTRDNCDCNYCVIEEEERLQEEGRERRRLSKLSKRRRVSSNGQRFDLVHYNLNERESPVMTSPFVRHQEKRSRDVILSVEVPSATPCGKRNLPKKTYSSTDLMISRDGYRADPDQDDDDVFADVSDDVLCEASLHHMQTRSARIVSPSSFRSAVVAGEELIRPRLDSVARLRSLRVKHIQDPAEEASIEKSSEPSSSPESDDRGYHSDTGASTSSSSSSSSSDERPRDVTLSSGDVPVEGCKVMDSLLKACDAMTNDVAANVGDVTEEKTKSAKFFSIKTWLHRRTGDAEAPQKANPGLKASHSQRHTPGHTHQDAASRLRRSSSLRKPKRSPCDSCFGSAQNLKELLERKGGIAAFRVFLQREFSEENLDFWLNTRDLKLLVKPTKARKTALKIFERYVADGSPNEINIDCQTREEIKSRLQDPNGATGAFDGARDRIYQLMDRDSFRRFLVSDLAHKCKA